MENPMKTLFRYLFLAVLAALLIFLAG